MCLGGLLKVVLLKSLQPLGHVQRNTLFTGKGLQRPPPPSGSLNVKRKEILGGRLESIQTFVCPSCALHKSITLLEGIKDRILMELYIHETL